MKRAGEAMDVIKKIHHVPIYVKDFERNLKFLNEVMGFPIVGTPIDKSLNVRFLKVGPDLIELMDEHQFTRSCQCALLVDDIVEEMEALKKRGLKMGELEVFEMEEGKLNFVFFKKFDGGWIELLERVNWNP